MPSKPFDPSTADMESPQMTRRPSATAPLISLNSQRIGWWESFDSNGQFSPRFRLRVCTASVSRFLVSGPSEVSLIPVQIVIPAVRVP